MSQLPGLEVQAPRRKVMQLQRDPADGTYARYRLECGHTVRRKLNLSKTWALCGECALTSQ